MPQTTYEQYPNLGFSGLIADSGYRNVNSHSAQSGGGIGHDQNIVYGHGVVLSDGEGVGVSVPLTATTPTTVVAGIATSDQKSAGNVGGGDNSAYLLEEAVNVMTKGRIWVDLDTQSPDVSAGDTVYMLPADYRTVGAGVISGDSTNGIEIPSARFVGAASGGEIVIVEINLP